MGKLIFTILVLLPFLTEANDGAYYTSGNHVIPIFETDISVQKEILTIKKRNKDFIEVTVYYEFFNPKADKEILVGFEAFAPQGDVDPTPRNGQHPYMRDFTVQMNGEYLTYNIAYINDSITTANGKINSLDFRKLTSDSNHDNYFYYVYNFKAKFKKGLNKVVHTYTYRISTSVAEYFAFDYVLTAANSWANKRIDDFTLVLDLGECEEFSVGKTFFIDPSEWLLNGLGKIESNDPGEHNYREFGIMQCVVQKGNLIFTKTNFTPQGELYVWLTRDFFMYSEDELEQLQTIPYSYYFQRDFLREDYSETERKILRSLPFARRGYIFKNKEIQDFYLKQNWYLPNPNYSSDVETLHPLEKEWLEKFK